MKKKMTRFRWWAKLKALVCGYYWMPCPVCGEMYAGFEAGDGCWPIDYGAGVSACAKSECETACREEWERRLRDPAFNPPREFFL